MPNISPISDLRNGDEALEKARAMVQLMSELNTGFSSGEAEGWVADSELDQRFAMK